MHGVANHVGIGNVIVHLELLDLGDLQLGVGGLHLGKSRAVDGEREGARQRADRHNAPGEHA